MTIQRHRVTSLKVKKKEGAGEGMVRATVLNPGGRANVRNAAPPPTWD